MKRRLLLLACLFVSILAMAEPITQDEAKQKASDFLSSRRTSALARGHAAMQLAATSFYQQENARLAPCYYVFNIGSDNGYVVASADDRMPAVLGYADSGSFDPNNVPDNMRSWLKEYERQMEFLGSHPEAAARRTLSGSSISPLLGQTKWNQGSPYNLLCPMDGEERSVTGCVATAMAQAMYYNRWPARSTAQIPGYTTSSQHLTLDAIGITNLDWNNMLPSYDGTTTEAQKNAVAQLMLMCGVSVSMDYSASGSGAYTGNVATALKNYFDYDASTRYVNRSNYRLAQWNQLVYDELSQSRVVVYSGQSSGGGHAFVIDGYDKDDYFHVNWGWGGGSNGYFLLSILDPGSSSGIGASSSTDGYSYDQGAVIGIRKNTGVPFAETVVLTSGSAEAGDAEVVRSSTAEDFTANVKAGFRNYLQNKYTFDFAFGLYDTNDNFISVVSGVSYIELEKGGWGWDGYEMTVKFGAGISSGTYKIKPISRQRNTTQWYANIGSDINFITANINGNTMTLQGPTFNLSGSIEASGKTETKSSVPLTVTINNNGTDFNDQIFLVVDGEMVSGRHYDINGGQSEVIGMSFVPETAGTKNLGVARRSWNSSASKYDYVPFITGTVTISEAVAANLSITATVENANASRVVSESTVKLKTTIRNNGLTEFDNDIRAYLYQDGHDGYFYGMASQTKQIKLNAGQTGSLNFEFSNLENERYLIIVSYKSAGEWKSGAQTPSFTVQSENTDVENFTVQSLELTGTMKTNSPVTATIKVKNDGTVTTGQLYVFADNALIKTLDLNIAADATQTYEAQFTPTTAGNKVVKVTSDAAGQTVLAQKTATITAPTVENFTVQSLELTGTMKTNSPVTATIKVKNDGTVTTGNLYVFADNTLIKTLDLNIAVGSTQTYEAQFTPTTTGDKVVKVTSDAAGQTVLMQKTAVITEPEILSFSVMSLNFTGTMKVNTPVTVNVKVKNDGNVATGKLYVFLDNVLLETLELNIATGAAEDYTCEFTPRTTGEKVVKVTNDAAGQEILAQKTAVITEADLINFVVESFIVDGTMKVGEPIAVSFSVRNAGNIEAGELYVFADDELIQKFYLNIPIGGSKDYLAEFIPETAGEKLITVTSDGRGNDILASKTITIIEPVTVKFTVQSLELTGDMETGSPVTASVTMKNEGNVNTGEAYLFVDDEMITKFELDITPGATQTYEVEFTPTTAGDKVVKVTSDEAGLTVLSQKIIQIAEGVIEKFTVLSFDVTGSMYVGEPLTTVIKVKNEGNTETGNLFLFVDNKIIEVVEMDIPLGKSHIYVVEYIPETAGEKIFRLTDLKDNTLAQKTITVSEKPVEKFTVSSFNISGTKLVGDPLTVKFTVENEGQIRTGSIYFVVQGGLTDELLIFKRINLNIEPGSAANFTESYTPTEPGEIGVGILAYPEDSDDIEELAYEFVTIETPSGIQAIAQEFQDGNFRVYALTGRLVTEVPAADLPSLMKRLPKGTYIVKPTNTAQPQKSYKVRN